MFEESPIDVVEQLDKAFNNKDIEAVLEFYEDDATLVMEPGKLASGKIALRNFFETVFKYNGVAKQDKIKIIEADDIALFISKWHLRITDLDKKSITKEFIATSVFRKNSQGKWRLLIDNSFGPAILD